MPRNDLTIYLRAEARAALDELVALWGCSRQEAIVKSLLIARESVR